MTQQWFALHLNPEQWAIGPINVVKKNNKFIPFVGRNNQLDEYKRAIKEDLTGKGRSVQKIEGKVKLTFYFWRQRADYSTHQARTHRKHEVDLTNIIKATEDALQGILFDNDKDTAIISAFLVEQGPDVEGKIIICAEPAPDMTQILDAVPAHVRATLEETPALFEPDDQWSKSDPGAIF